MPVRLTLQNATATTANVSIQLQKAEIRLASNRAVSVGGALVFTRLSISAHGVSLWVATGTALSGTIDLPVAASGNGTQSIQINNVTADTVYVEWPAPDGPTVQELTPGVPMALADLQPD